MTLLVITVCFALAFDFTNGFHDTANAVATSVSTRAVSPRLAVAIAAIANLGGAFATTAVAKTVGQGIIDTNLATEKTVLAAVIGAIVWNLLTWWLGLPSSSSHALIGGLVGAALAESGTGGVEWHGIVHKVVIPALWAPTIAFAAAFGLLIGIYWVFRWMTPGLANRSFRLGQLATGTWVGFAHGANDAQKTMGVIALALYSEGPHRPLLHSDVGEDRGGTHHRRGHVRRRLADHPNARTAHLPASTPGWPFAAQASAGAVIYASTHLGYPLSTTHVVSGAVMGAGATKRLSAVRWGVAGNIVFAGSDDPRLSGRRSRLLLAGEGGLLIVRFGLGSGSAEMYALLAAAGENAVEIAVKVEQRFREYPSSAVSQADVKELEHVGDRIVSELLRSVEVQFVTPYDREDIVALAFAVDEVPDKIENASELLGLYGIEAPTRQSLELCALLVRATGELSKLLARLKGLRGSAEEVLTIKAIEDEADRVARAARAGLFKDDRIDPVIVIRWKGIYEALEDAVDACETAAHRIGNILVKNA